MAKSVYIAVNKILKSFKHVFGKLYLSASVHNVLKSYLIKSISSQKCAEMKVKKGELLI